MRPGKHLLELIAVAAALGLGCADASSPSEGTAAGTVEAGAGDLSLPEPAEAQVRALVEGNTRFALDLFGLLAEGDGNLAFSPASISAAFGMTSAGARGETAEQMREALGFGGAGEAVHAAFGVLLRDWNDTGEEGPELRAANRLFGDAAASFHRQFLELTRAAYGSELEALDLRGAPEASRETINRWIEEQTADRIPDLLPPGSITTDARLILVNAIYFKGLWRAPFREEATAPLPFYRPGGGSEPVPMMQQEGPFGYAEIDGLAALRLPYEGGALAMYVFLPDARDGLPELESLLDPEHLATWLEAVRDREVRVLLPRFTIEPESAVRLQPALSALGMPLPFEKEADFSGISDEKPLFIHDAYHKAFVEVNEEGTEAAGATGVVVGTESVSAVRPPVFRADHPFLFLIRDERNGSILFLGRVADPAG